MEVEDEEHRDDSEAICSGAGGVESGVEDCPDLTVVSRCFCEDKR